MVNKVILVGNVGADPEIRTFENGSKVARVRLATTERYYNKDTKERKDMTEWHTLTMWAGLANLAEQYIRKGSQLYIEGRIRNTEWQDSNGNKRYGVEILTDVVNLLGRKGDGDSNAGRSYTGGNAQQQAPRPQTMPQQQQTTAGQAPVVDNFDDDDDLPF